MSFRPSTGSEESYRCGKCKQQETYLYNSLDEVVSYLTCDCHKRARKNNVKPLDAVFKQLDALMLKPEKTK